MKIFFLSAIFFASQSILAQTIPSSERPIGICSNCFPPGWAIGTGTPDVSNATSASAAGTTGGGATWNVPGGILPLPPNGHTTWISLRDLGGTGPEEIVSTTMTGLVIGNTYEVTLYTLTATTLADGQAGAAYASVYNDEFRYMVGANPIQTISPITQDVWGTENFRFIAAATTETLQLLPGDNSAGPPVGIETVQIAITLNAIVAVPITQDDNFTTSQNLSLNGDVFADNDNGVDQFGTIPTTVTAFDAASSGGGVVNVNADGTFTYTPAVGFTGVDTFTYTITDANLSPSTATVTINVIPVASGNDSDGDGILNTDECSLMTSTNANWTNNGIDVYTIGGLTDGTSNTASGWDADVTANGAALTSITDWGVLGASTPFSGPGYAISHSTTPLALFSAVSSAANNIQAGAGGTGINITPPDADISAPFTFTTTITFTSAVNAAAFELIDMFDIPAGYQMNVEVEVDGTPIWQTVLADGVGGNAIGPIDVADGTGTVQINNMTFGNDIENFIGVINPFGFTTITINYIVPSPVALATVADSQGFDNLRFGAFLGCDDDGDLIANFLDLDSDNDGILDALEGNGDLDGDTIPNFLDLDSDGDGVSDLNEAGHTALDANNDGIIDGLPVDFGTNGLYVGIEDFDTLAATITYTSLNSDGDSAFDFLDVDDDGDGVNTAFEVDNADLDGNPTTGVVIDSDTDTVLDYLDADDDGDGVNTAFEVDNADLDGDPTTGVVIDTDTDTVLDYLDIDDDNDGVNTEFEVDNADLDGDPTTGVVIDTDTDTVLDYLDTDDDGDGVNTEFEVDNADGDGDPTTGVVIDTDTDTILDYLDLDDDGDGVNTEFEVDNTDGDGDPTTGVVIDTNTDTVLDYLDVDDDGDGVNTEFEVDNADGDGDPTTGVVVDTDTDTLLDYLDTDDDGDGVNTEFEVDNADGDGNPTTGVAVDTDSDTVLDYLDADDDGDGIDTINENPDPNNDGDPADAEDSDLDTIPNYLDADDDGDGIDTADEDADGDGDPLNDDTDGDGIPNYLDLDSNNDGILDVDQTNADTDGDSIPNYIDLDADNDGIYNVVEAGLGSFDTDNDGVVNLGSVGTNGLFDALETFPDSGVLNPIYAPLDSTTDASGNPLPDGIFDFLELDSDTDGCFDSLEAGYTDGDADGILGTSPATTGPTGLVTSGIDGYTTPNNVNGGPFDFQEYNQAAAVITQPTAPGAVIIGNPVTINDATSNGNEFRWQFSPDNGVTPFVDILDSDVNYTGQNTEILTLPNAQLALLGYYRLEVTVTNYVCDTTPAYTNAVLVSIQTDNDGDGVADVIDLDDDNDGIPDTDEDAGGNLDVDGDGIPNRLDLDSDNDGIYDIVESGQLNGTTIVDANNDGILDAATPGSVGANGLLDLLEDAPDSGVLALPTADSDADGIADSNEINADDDGCSDVLEAGFTDTDGNGLLGTGDIGTGLTIDANGVVTSGVDGYTTPDDNDTNGIFDFQEVGEAVVLTTQPIGQTIIINSNANFDVVGTAAVFQWQESTDGGTSWNNITDGGANPTYAGAMTDALTLTTVPLSFSGNQYRVILSSPAYACDGDITSDEVVLNMFADNDLDGIPDITDLDDDNDGIPDVDEALGGNPDIDGDGVPNQFDLDSDNDGIYDVVESGQMNGTTILDADNNGILDGAPSLFGANGLFDALEDAPDSGVLNVATADSDNDGIPDSNELNSDNDGCSDVLEAGYTDTDGSGRLGADVGLTVDANGLVNTPGLTDGYTTPNDNDSNGIFDFQEVGAQVTLIDQPMDQTITINSNANFDVTGSSPTYQWQESTDGGTTWNNVSNGGTNPVYSGATTDALTLTLVPGSFDGNQYRVILSSPAFVCGGNITSNAATLTVQSDFDGDGIGDPIDLDSDNDGIPNTDEYPDIIDPVLNDPYGDPDGDGAPNYLDPQPNNPAVVGDGVTVNPTYDLDGDNIPNHLDTDADGDGLFDAIEAGHAFINTDANGFIIGADTGSGANGLFDGVETTPESGVINYTITDSDNDGDSNFLDADDDNDGVDTIIETANGDTDGDGVDDYLDIDDDNDGILTATEGTANSDSDSFPNYLDQDSDGDGISDNVEGQTTVDYTLPTGDDTDNDGLDDAYDNFDNLTVNDPNNNVATENGIQAGDVNSDAGLLGGDSLPDYLDEDSDGDTVLDSIEGHDLNEDGVADNFPSGDLDNDGLDDSFDRTIGFGDPNGLIVTTNPATDLPDTDGTEDVNFRDNDDDGDSIGTRFEDGDTSDALADVDTDSNGTPNYLDNDDDGDTVLTIDENPNADTNGNPINPQDTDEDGKPDYLDDDDDNDGIDTIVEGTGDTDGDSRADYLDIDDDNDGVLTSVEGDNDDDGDSLPNYLDLDSDADGIPDNVEGQTTTGYIAPDLMDADNDGLDDAYDNSDGYPDSEGVDPEDTDADGDPDYIDTDSDDDNVPDFVEGHDFDADGNPDVEALNEDLDNDGLDDAYDSTGGISGDYSDPSGNVVTDSPLTELPNRDQSLFDEFSATLGTSVLDFITPDDQVDYRDTDDDGDGRLTDSIGADGEDTDGDGDPRNDNCNGPPDNNSPNYLDPVGCNFIPSGFSPDGDNLNEEFIINQLSQFPNFTMEVYDRWGNAVYEYSNDGRLEPEWWDGFSTGSRTLRKGEKVPVGTYYYVIEYNQGGRSPVAGWVYINY